MPNFQPKQRVRMKRTENIGTVTTILPGGLVQVLLDGGMGHIPLPEETLELLDPPRPVEKPAPASAPKAIVAPDDQRASGGIQLALDPQLNGEGEPESYVVYLLNAGPHKIVYEVVCLTHAQRRWAKSATLEGYGKHKLETAPYDWLNEKLSFNIDVRALRMDGTGPRHYQQLKIKPKQFFTHFEEVPELFREAHLYRVFPQLDTRTVTTPTERGPSLKSITNEQLRNRPQADDSKRLVTFDLANRMEFSEELDLHLPALVPNPSAVPKHQVLSTQMKFFDDYIDEALRLGVDRVFIIHGVGNGILKREVHKRLHYVQFVKSYKCQYHEKYGFGATEVVFS